MNYKNITANTKRVYLSCYAHTIYRPINIEMVREEGQGAFKDMQDGKYYSFEHVDNLVDCMRVGQEQDLFSKVQIEIE